MLGQRHLPGCSPQRPNELLTAPGCAAAAPRKLRGQRREKKGGKPKAGNPKEPEPGYAGMGTLVELEATAGWMPWLTVLMSVSIKPRGVQERSGPPAHPFQLFSACVEEGGWLTLGQCSAEI